MSTTSNIAPEIKDKIVEHLNEMLSAENAAVDRLNWRIEEYAFCQKVSSNCNTIKMRLDNIKKG